jgi:hypothetical protein
MGRAMKRPVTPAQRASQLTWRLKGELKNIRIAYLRAGGMLAKMRDEKLFRARRLARSRSRVR